MSYHIGIKIKEDVMEKLIPAFEVIILIISLFSIALLCFGVLLCAYDLLKIFLKRYGRTERRRMLQHAKTDLGGFVLLGLELLIVADIIETVIRPTVEDIARLAAIVAIRTVISCFLNKEIKEIKEDEETNR